MSDQTDEFVEKQNKKRQEALGKDYLPLRHAGFLLADYYPSDAHARLVASIRQMQKPGQKAVLFRFRPDEIPQLQDSGYLHGSSWLSVGHLAKSTRRPAGDPEARDLPDEFDAVMVDVFQAPDLGYMVLYGFVLKDDLESKVREAYIHSEDFIEEEKGQETGVAYRQRGLSGGRLEEIEKKARLWVSQFVTGSWINLNTVEKECPTVWVLVLEDSSYQPKDAWLESRYLFFHRLGYDVAFAAGSEDMLLLPSAIKIRGSATSSRGFALVFPNRLAKEGPGRIDAWNLVYEAANFMHSMDLWYYSTVYGLKILALDIPQHQDQANESRQGLDHLIMDMSKLKKLRIGPIKQLQRVNDKISTFHRDIRLEMQGHRQHVQATERWVKSFTRELNLQMVYTRLFPSESFGAYAVKEVEAMHNLISTEFQELDTRFSDESNHADSLLRSSSTIVNLQLQSLIWRVTAVILAVTVIIGVLAIIIPLVVPHGTG